MNCVAVRLQGFITVDLRPRAVSLMTSYDDLFSPLPRSPRVWIHIGSCQWTPEGRRLLTGSMSGELTLWNGLTFNFETILRVRQCGRIGAGTCMHSGANVILICWRMQAHDSPMRFMEWSHNCNWMVTVRSCLNVTWYWWTSPGSSFRTSGSGHLLP